MLNVLNVIATQLHLYKQKLTEALPLIHKALYTTGKKLLDEISTELVDAYKFYVAIFKASRYLPGTEA